MEVSNDFSGSEVILCAGSTAGTQMLFVSYSKRTPDNIPFSSHTVTCRQLQPQSWYLRNSTISNQSELDGTEGGAGGLSTGPFNCFVTWPCVIKEFQYTCISFKRQCFCLSLQYVNKHVVKLRSDPSIWWKLCRNVGELLPYAPSQFPLPCNALRVPREAIAYLEWNKVPFSKYPSWCTRSMSPYLDFRWQRKGLCRTSIFTSASGSFPPLTDASREEQSQLSTVSSMPPLLLKTEG